MKEVSNRVVSLFLVLALVSTVGGFLVILTSIGGDFSLLTGLATTQTATVNVTVQATSAIIINPSIVEFGSGTLLGIAGGTPINTSGTTNVGGFNRASPILVQNDGNTNLNITLNGTPAANWLDSGSTYQWGGVAAEGGCPSANLTTTRNTFSATLTRICGNLTFSDAADSFNISIFLNLSSSLVATTYTDPAVLIRADAHV